MKNFLKVLALSLVLLPLIAAESAQTPSRTVPKQPSWVQLKPELQKILAPLTKDWDQLPDSQRQRILATAKRYPKMKPAEQQRYSERLLEWSKLSLKQRDVARERFKQFQRLPPEHREQIRRRWAEQPPTEKAQPDEPTLAPKPAPTTEPSSRLSRPQDFA